MKFGIAYPNLLDGEQIKRFAIRVEADFNARSSAFFFVWRLSGGIHRRINSMCFALVRLH